MENLPQIPTIFYVVVGVMILGNLSLILTLLTIIFKAGRFVTATEMGVANATNLAKLAHKRIDKLAEETGH
jgi:hypothetical protein